jgi:uncharacterized protein
MPDAHAEQPVALRERILGLDVLRGFAMLGVLVAYCMWSLGTAPEESWSAFDKRLDEVVAFIVDGKFYTILAFLFGLGFSIQLGRASDDSAAVEIYCRRLAILAGIGLIHALLLRNGDILLPYALTGFLLIPFRGASDRVLITTAFALLLFTVGVRAFWTDLGLPSLDRPQLEDASYLVENAAWVRYWYSTALFTWPVNLMMFLFGLCAGRRQIIPKLAKKPRALLIIAGAGLVAGFGFYFARLAVLHAMAPSARANSLAWMMFTFHCWGLSSAYAALLLLALRTAPGQAALAPLAAVGRLALTNYLSQSGIIVPLCLAFGWFDRFTPTSSLALAGAVFILVQLPFSIFWAQRFQFGPAEWMWRLLTYQRVPPLRLNRSSDFAPL